jgi:ferredoxin
MVRIIQEECVGCGVCAEICPEGIEMVNGKARIKNENSECLKKGAEACPKNAILLNESSPTNIVNSNTPGLNQGRRMGRGQGAGQGRGLGLGPRDGRGRGKGGGGR